MHWLFADETNVTPDQGKFFIYGGLVATPDQIVACHKALKEIRSRFGFTDTDQFKFHTRSRPEQIPLSDWNQAKSEALKAGHTAGVRMLVYVVHHGIAKGAEGSAKVEFALNTLISHFDLRYLRQYANAYGAVCIDRIDEDFGYRHLRDRFQKPLSLPGGREVALERVVHYSMTCDGASHMSSLVDLAVGGFRYCVNAAMGAGKGEVAEQVIRPIADMMWGVQRGDKFQIGDYGLVKRPIVVKSEAFKADYDELTRLLGEYSNKSTTSVV
ncbi:hypothetical protein [Streptomyces sp. DASNCL29]|uniref:hypothetical protein n=1 Tax=Streptomyces sp. DASNCL29 TaxID=2583819 RepID=UPI00110FE01B|nr:hypothetical protein [Streptomyces sp. DASNCL29]TMU93680.1 hypothetical protein FGK60_30335 [Streptomyces sp. DASNCL29]